MTVSEFLFEVSGLQENTPVYLPGGALLGSVEIHESDGKAHVTLVPQSAPPEPPQTAVVVNESVTLSPGCAIG